MKKLLPFLIITAIIIGGFYYWDNYKTTSKSIDSNLLSTKKDTLQDYYQTGQDMTKKQDNTEITFLAVGDIMLSRNVAGTMLKNQKNSSLPFNKLDTLLNSTDFNFGNLESPFSGNDEFENNVNSFTFNAPTWTINGLSKYNFKILNLANNHILNQGKNGINFTKSYLEENSIKTVGVGSDKSSAWQGEIYESKGIKIGFIGASYAPVSPYVANIGDVEKIKRSITQLKNNSDFVVATMHAGTEYTTKTNQDQIDFARAAIDNGADIVIGAHPHWIQPFEVYKGKYIFYSLGNFVFDQEWSQATKEGLTLKITLNKSGKCNNQAGSSACGNDIQGSPVPTIIKQIELIPVIIENYSTPRLATEQEKQNIFKKIDVTTNVITP